jgi:hypothetical protein
MHWTGRRTIGLTGAHEIPLSSLNRAPLGFGVDWTVQLVPFQRSANVPNTPGLLSDYPTAVQVVVRGGHDTPDRVLNVLPGLGVGVIAQPAAPAAGAIANAASTTPRPASPIGRLAEGAVQRILMMVVDTTPTSLAVCATRCRRGIRAATLNVRARLLLVGDRSDAAVAARLPSRRPRATARLPAGTLTRKLGAIGQLAPLPAAQQCTADASETREVTRDVQLHGEASKAAMVTVSARTVCRAAPYPEL